MSKTKKFIVLGGTVGLIGLAGMGWWIWGNQSDPPLNKNLTGVQGTNTEQSLSQTSDPNSISLTRPRPQPKSSNGLSVAPSSGANNLGQLTPDENKTGNSTSKTSSAQPIDPATFEQYDKYKDGDSALFGEVQVGTGDELTVGKKAAVYYKGWLTDGQLFDTTRPDKDGKQQPFVFEMGASQVIPGWEQGLIGMKVGGTRLVIIPPAVGYGAAGQGPVPGNSVLVFQVQLLAVQ